MEAEPGRARLYRGCSAREANDPGRTHQPGHRVAADDAQLRWPHIPALSLIAQHQHRCAKLLLALSFGDAPRDTAERLPVWRPGCYASSPNGANVWTTSYMPGSNVADFDLCCAGEELNKPLLMCGVNREDIDQRHDAALRG